MTDALMLVSLISASLSAGIMFFGSWIFFMESLDYPRNIIFGWLPGTILAIFAFDLGYFLWPLIILLALVFLLLMAFETMRT